MKRVIACIALIVALCGDSSLRAEPSATVRRLMKEPMSVFDWGLFRLNRDLQEEMKFEQSKQFQPSRVYVDYTSETNTIQIAVFVSIKQQFLKEMSAKDICRNVTNYVRRILVSELPDEMRAHLGIARYFETSSFRMSEKILMKEMEAITRIKVNVAGMETDTIHSAKKTVAECDSPLLGKNVFVSDGPAIKMRKQ